MRLYLLDIIVLIYSSPPLERTGVSGAFWARVLQSLHGTPSMYWSEYTLIEWG